MFQDRRLRVWGGGASLLSVHVVLAHLSSRFGYGRGLSEMPIVLFSFLSVLAGLLYLWVAGDLLTRPKESLSPSKPDEGRSEGHGASVKAGSGRIPFLWLLGVGVVVRAVMMFSTPILEDDYYRYLWDGAVLGHGFNPYAYSPWEVVEGVDPVPPSLHELASQSREVAGRINHLRLRSVYPPVAQLAFTLAFFIKPWSLFGLRIVFLLFDLAALVLLMATLKELGISPWWVGLYWLNPLLVKEVYNSGHMDVLVAPFLVGTVWLFLRGKFVWASAVIGLATGVKVWPVLWVPLVVRPLFSKLGRLVVALLFVLLVVSGMFIPVYMAGIDQTSGFMAYSRRWEMNDALFMGFLWIMEAFQKMLVVESVSPQFATRVLVLLILFALALWATWKKPEGGIDFCGRCLFVTAALFLLSPTQFPWYYLWILPLLAIRPRYSLLLLTALLPLYYLRFYFYASHRVEIFDNLLVWVEYVPVLILLLWERYRAGTERNGGRVAGIGALA